MLDVNVTYPNLQKVIRILRDRKIFSRLAFRAQYIIEKRIESGRTLRGGAKQYSDAYKKKRQRAGLPVDHVYMEYSGMTLAAMTHKANPGSAQLYFALKRAERIAYYHTFAGAGKHKILRPFWGLTRKEKTAINIAYGQWIAQRLAFMNE